MDKKSINKTQNCNLFFKNIKKNNKYLYENMPDNIYKNNVNEDNDFFEKHKNKFSCTESGSSRRNKDKEEKSKNILIHFVGYYDETDENINVEYNEFYSYVCDNKIKNITQYLADKIINHIVNKSETLILPF